MKDLVKGHWLEMKGQIKQHWGKFTDDEIAQMEGSSEALIGGLQKKYGYAKEQAEREVKSFLQDYTFSGKAEKIFEEVKEHSKEARVAVEGYVKKNPFAAIGTAFLVGVGIAFLLRR
jgi:uncharacterized protein YjbJ (UPF0337 family)